MKAPFHQQDAHNSGDGGVAFARGGLGRAVKIAAAGSLFAGVAFAAGFAIFANHIGSLSAPTAPRVADAIIVLTGGQSRIDVAVDLLKSGKGKRLLISGVNPKARRDDLRVATGADKSLFNCCVDIDRAALDTIGNAEESAKWVRQHAYESVILVTNNYHMPRSLLEMRRLLRDAEVQPYPVVNTRLDGGSWITKPGAIRVMLTEYTKYLASLARGALTDTTLSSSYQTVRASAADAPRR